MLSFVLWRKYFQAAYYYLDDPPSATRGGSPQLSEIFDDSEYASIPVNQWSKHVQDLHADGDLGFSREYEAIQQATDIDLSCQHSQLVENKNKNRYVNIVAYDHTRVMLKPLPGQKKSGQDYINANYIDVRKSFSLKKNSLFYLNSGLWKVTSLRWNTRTSSINV